MAPGCAETRTVAKAASAGTGSGRASGSHRPVSEGDARVKWRLRGGPFAFVRPSDATEGPRGATGAQRRLFFVHVNVVVDEIKEINHWRSILPLVGGDDGPTPKACVGVSMTWTGGRGSNGDGLANGRSVHLTWSTCETRSECSHCALRLDV